MKLLKKFSSEFFLFWAFFWPALSHASACCGGAGALPTVITSDDRAIVTATWSYSKAEADVLATGVWRKKQENEILQTFRLDAARIWQDRFQWGASVPFQFREKSSQQGGRSSGLGDTSLLAGYEYLPDWDYNVWRPRGIGFLTLTLPTGKSIYDAGNESGFETQGKGFWSLGAGTVLTKSWNRWDANASVEIHRAFEKEVRNDPFNGTVIPGWGKSFSVGGGFNTQAFRLGGTLSWNQEDPIRVTGTTSSDGSEQTFATATLSGSYLANSNWTSTVTLADQTLLGNPSNTTLSKSVAIFLQHRWPR